VLVQIKITPQISIAGTCREDPILEGADVVHLDIAHILEHLAGERRAPAGSAIDDDGLVFKKPLYLHTVKVEVKVEIGTLV
jgi:hypothetical protein